MFAIESSPPAVDRTYGGYRRVHGYAREVATRLSGLIAELGPFELLTKGDELPVFAFKVRDDVTNFSVFDVSDALRERGSREQQQRCGDAVAAYCE